MKIRFNILTKIILVIFLWLACIYKLYIDYDHEYLMDSLIHTGLIVVAGIISVFAINADYSQYKQQKRLILFLSTATTLLCVSGLLLTVYFLKKQDQTTSVLYATRNTSGLGQITVDFRENNTYKLGRHNFMSAKYQRGHFTIKDSIIYLDNPYPSEQIMSDRLLIRTRLTIDSAGKGNLLKVLFGSPEDDITAKAFLYQVNHTRQIIDSAISFKVSKKQ